MRRSAFTLVEVLLALGVVVIGICSIMVLFPVGANATRDASMETYSANSVEELLTGIKYQILQNGKWTDYVGTGPDGNDGFIDALKDSGTVEERFNGKKDEYDSLTDAKWENVAINTKSGFYKYNDSSRSGKEDVYQLVNYRDLSKSLDEGSVDFRAIARLAKSKVKIGDVSIGYDKAVCIHVEVSWPAEAPFDARQVAYYSMEVFKNDN